MLCDMGKVVKLYSHHFTEVTIFQFMQLEAQQYIVIIINVLRIWYKHITACLTAWCRYESRNNVIVTLCITLPDLICDVFKFVWHLPWRMFLVFCNDFVTNNYLLDFCGSSMLPRLDYIFNVMSKTYFVTVWFIPIRTCQLHLFEHVRCCWLIL